MKRQKEILLIQAISMEGPGIEVVYPIGLVTVGTYLNKSESLRASLLDLNMEEDPYAALEGRLFDRDWDGIGLSFRNVDPLGNRTTSLVVPLKITARFIRRRKPDTPLFIGGTGFSLFPERLMEEIPEIDFGFIGESEGNIVSFVERAIRKDPLIRQIPGAVFREGGKILSNGRAPGFDMEKYEIVDRSLLDPKRYLEKNHYVESIGIEGKRGCIYSCAYCSYPALQGSRMRLRPVGDILDELEMIRDVYGAERFHFTDPIVNFPPEHLDAVCEGMIARGIDLKWSGFFREDAITQERADLYQRAGCECFSLSPDGLSENALGVLGKRLSTDEILRCASILSKTGVVSVYHFLVNTPGMKEEEIDEARALIEKIYDLHRDTIGTVVLNLIRILPGTAVETMALEDGTIDPDTDLLYPTYYDPQKNRTMRFELEAEHQYRNIEAWQAKLRKEQHEDHTP